VDRLKESLKHGIMQNILIIVKEGPNEEIMLDGGTSNRMVFLVIDGWHRVNALSQLALSDSKLGFLLNATIYRNETPPKIMVRLALGMKLPVCHNDLNGEKSFEYTSE
jgi:hypothetical protein